MTTDRHFCCWSSDAEKRFLVSIYIFLLKVHCNYLNLKHHMGVVKLYEFDWLIDRISYLKPFNCWKAIIYLHLCLIFSHMVCDWSYQNGNLLLNENWALLNSFKQSLSICPYLNLFPSIICLEIQPFNHFLWHVIIHFKTSVVSSGNNNLRKDSWWSY